MLLSVKPAWKQVRVPEVAAPSPYALATGPFGSAISSRFFRSSGVPVIRGSNLSASTLIKLSDENLVFIDKSLALQFGRSLARRGDLVFTCWGTIDQVGLIDADSSYPEYIVSNKQMKLTPDVTKTEPLFLYYLFSSQTIQSQVSAASIGSSVPGFNLGLLKSLVLNLPPLPEQRAIAEALGDVDALIAAQEKLIAKKQAIKTATMQLLLTGKQRLPGFGEGCGTKQTEIGVIPEDWRVAKVGDVGAVQLGRQRAPRHHSGSHMRPYLRVANVFENRIDTTDVLHMNFSPAEFEKYRLCPGDILLNEGQSRELVGRPAMFEGRLKDACFQNTLVRFKSGPEFNSHFALQIFLHCYREGRLAEISRQTTSIAHLGAERFAKLEIPHPPLDEQRELAAVARDFEDEITTLEKRLAKTKAIKQGMMQELLTGRTRLV